MTGSLIPAPSQISLTRERGAYSTLLINPDIGVNGQPTAAEGCAYCIGAGGLSSPHLAAAGMVPSAIIDETTWMSRIATPKSPRHIRTWVGRK